MKLVYVLPSFSGDFNKPSGGVEVALLNLISGILNCKSNYTVYLVFPDNSQAILNLPEGIFAVPVKALFRKNWTYNYPFIGINKNIEKEIKKINPDIIHVYAAPGFYRNFDKSKTFLTVHGIPYIDSIFRKRFASKLKAFITKYIFINDLKRYRNIIFLVSYAYSLFKDHLDKSTRIYFIPNPLLKNNNRKEQKMNNIPIFFFSGILRPLKNIEAIITACYYLKQEGYKFHLKLAGNFESLDYEKKIIEMVKKYNLLYNIDFLGNLNSNALNSILNTIDINLLPSFQEVCPMSIIEAMALGKPSIASSVGGIPEIVCNKFNGLIIPIDNSEELAQSMKCIINDPFFYASLATNCIKMSQVYNLLNITKQVLECYK